MMPGVSAGEQQRDDEIALLREQLAAQGRELVELRQRNTNLRQVMERSMDPIFLHDRVGRVLDCNRRACEVLGYSRAELLTMTIPDFEPTLGRIPPERRGENWDRMPLDRPVSASGMLRCRDGREIPMELVIGVFLEGSERRFVAIARDISERVRAAREQARLLEVAQAASRAKGEFLAHMSHELRTPLNAIIGYSELLVEDATDPSVHADLNRIQTAARHLLGTINNILDLSKLEAGQMELSVEPVVVEEVLSSVLAISRPLVRKRGNELALERDSPPRELMTDGGKLRQVLLNLVGNAAKYTERGRITLRAQGRQHEGETRLRLEVVDTGVGIAQDELERLFDPFVQVGDEERRAGGTGLGLAIARHYCALLGGALWAESELGRGSTFIVELPVKPPRDEV